MGHTSESSFTEKMAHILRSMAVRQTPYRIFMALGNRQDNSLEEKIIENQLSVSA